MYVKALYAAITDYSDNTPILISLTVNHYLKQFKIFKTIPDLSKKSSRLTECNLYKRANFFFYIMQKPQYIPFFHSIID